MNDQNKAIFAPGMILGQRYEILRHLRSEAQGEVLLARDQVLDVDVGLKFLASEHPEFDRLLEYYRLEAVWGLRLHHPQILGVHHLDETSEGVFLIREPFAGSSLWELLDQTEALTTSDSLYFIEVLAQGLAFGHKQGVSHQNFNPHQVLVSATDGIKIENFAFPAEPAEIQAHPEIRAYIAPEVWQGRHPGTASNLFSLGVIGFRMLTGVLPFPLQTGGEYPYEITAAPQQFDEIPEALRPLFSRCLKPEPEKRFQNAADFLSRLAALRERLTPAAALKPVSRPEELIEPVADVREPSSKPLAGPREPEVEIDSGWEDASRVSHRSTWGGFSGWLEEQKALAVEYLGPEPLRRNRRKQIAAAIGGGLAFLIVFSGLSSLFSPKPKLAKIKAPDLLVTEPAQPAVQALPVPKPTPPPAPTPVQEPLPEPPVATPQPAQPKPAVEASTPPAVTPAVKAKKPATPPVAAKPEKPAAKPAPAAPAPKAAKPETANKLVATLNQETAARKKADALTRQGQKAIVRKASKGNKTVYQVWVLAPASAGKPAPGAPKPTAAPKPPSSR